MAVQSKLTKVTARSGLPAELQPALATFLRAYGLGWALSSVPTFLVLLIKTVLALVKGKNPGNALVLLFSGIRKILKDSVTNNGLPYVMAGAFGCHRFVAYLLTRISFVNTWLTKKNIQRISIFFSAATTMHLVRRSFKSTKTMDLTLLAFSRALDVLAHRAYVSPIVRKHMPSWLLEHFSVVAFTAVTTEAVWSWMYEPERLPRSYSTWVAGVAGVDDRILQTLRNIRNGTFTYGSEAIANGAGPLIGVCKELGIDTALADPMHGRLPCSAIHNGLPFGCEVAGLDKFAYVFSKGFPLYFTVHALPPLLFSTRRLINDPAQGLLQILKGSVMSASFLASLIASIFYIICLIRTRIGHQLLGIPQAYLDSPWTPFLGCVLSGATIMVESKHRRAEMALYVAPRALQSFLDRLLEPYKRGRWWESVGGNTVETLVFATSLTVILEALYTNDTMLRSSVKSLFSWILKDELREAKAAKEAAQAKDEPVKPSANIPFHG
ncbi:hypothetical protein CLU79DRAFT_793209 [Phycomyces nitens]|nr:hypothetical protein CLU79DRAFT_793209 [Phycomyces nitens]